jgi:hypothetical protein
MHGLAEAPETIGAIGRYPARSGDARRSGAMTGTLISAADQSRQLSRRNHA